MLNNDHRSNNENEDADSSGGGGGGTVRMMLHYYTEVPYTVNDSLIALRESAPVALAFPENEQNLMQQHGEDEKAAYRYHTWAKLHPANQCPELLLERVHVIVNNSPREAMVQPALPLPA